MNRVITILSITVFVPLTIFSQKAIEPKDVVIHTQLTFLKVSVENVVGFEKSMGRLSKLFKEVKLNEQYEWLTYKYDTGQYLIINFSNNLADVLTLESYRNIFSQKRAGQEFDAIMHSMARLSISLERNYIIQMLLPWSTVEAISVTEFPLATMVEYSIPTNRIEQFDIAMRQFVELLKETKYPYPLESNRGNIGAYGTMALVWFYDEREDFFGKNRLLEWMDNHGQKETYQSIMDTIETISNSKKEYQFDYQKVLSY